LIDSHRRVDTPTGEGAFIHQFGLKPAGAQALTILSGFKYRYPQIKVTDKSVLYLSFGMPFMDTDGAGLKISVSNSSGTNILINNSDVRFSGWWQIEQLTLMKYANRTVDFEFEVYSPSRDQSGDWVGFKDMMILSNQNWG